MKKCLALILLSLVLCASVRALEVGDKAPALKVEKWLNGSPVDPSRPDGKTFYVVEFWATWCPPCRVSIPQLNELHKKLKARDVIIVGVTDEDEKKVNAFTKDTEILYRVGLDTEGTASEAYMEGIDGIPHAFVVDTNGVVVWSGHPLSGLEEDIEQILNGSFDLSLRKKQQDAEAELAELFRRDTPDAALKKLDELIELAPENFPYYQAKAGLLAHYEKYGELKNLYRQMLVAFADDAENLNTLAWMIITSPLQFRDLETALTAAQKSNTLSGEKLPPVLDTLARIYYAVGLIDQAIETQRKAVTLTEDGEDKEEMNSILDYYRTVEALRANILSDGQKEGALTQ
ncbi:MAG: redoxin domain-containing protein [Verrucomicrobia bacterium]|nr:redoxin domain-containing protein [Verrucomicrobiota bacterium]